MLQDRAELLKNFHKLVLSNQEDLATIVSLESVSTGLGEIIMLHDIFSSRLAESCGKSLGSQFDVVVANVSAKIRSYRKI